MGLAIAMLSLIGSSSVFLQGCGDGDGGDGGPSLPSSIDCDGDAGGCHADLECLSNGYPQYVIHNCPDFNGQGGRLDATATCEEFAADLELEDSRKKAMVCCVASGDACDDAACIRNAVCTNSSQALVQKVTALMSV